MANFLSMIIQSARGVLLRMYHIERYFEGGGDISGMTIVQNFEVEISTSLDLLCIKQCNFDHAAYFDGEFGTNPQKTQQPIF